jgi:hypothetical protein
VRYIKYLNIQNKPFYWPTKSYFFFAGGALPFGATFLGSNFLAYSF